MQCTFRISCESTVDLPFAYVNSRGMPVLFYSYAVDMETYEDDMGRDPAALPRFYRFLDSGKLPSTSQLTEYQYETFFEEQLQAGDLLHIAFGTGMTPAVQNAYRAAEKLRERYPERRLVVIDSLCSSSGYGLLVDCAADMRDDGRDMDEIIAWLNENRTKVHHQFFSTDLKFFRRSGRVSGPAATVGAILGICPIMRLDDRGRIIAYDKVRGKKSAIQRTIQTMARHARDGANYAGKCFICHSNCLATAQETLAAVEKAFPKLAGTIRICDIGTIIASHCGPGTVAVFFLGDDRAPEGEPV